MTAQDKSIVTQLLADKMKNGDAFISLKERIAIVDWM